MTIFTYKKDIQSLNAPSDSPTSEQQAVRRRSPAAGLVGRAPETGHGDRNEQATAWFSLQLCAAMTAAQVYSGR